MNASPRRRRPWADQRGAAAVEFVLLFPIMAALLAIVVFGGQGFEIDRKLNMTARTLTDLTAQQTDVGASGAISYSQILGAAACVMVPYAETQTPPCASVHLTMQLSEVKSNGDGTAAVVWSKASSGSALTVGATVSAPSSAVSGSYLILGQTQYNYSPLSILTPLSSMTLSASLFLAPRNGSVACTGC